MCVIVNTASKCGFTKQFAPLQELYDEYGQSNGLKILGFPCNQFAGQVKGWLNALFSIIFIQYCNNRYYSCCEEEVQPYRKTEYKPIIYNKLFIYCRILEMMKELHHFARKIMASLLTCFPKSMLMVQMHTLCTII